MAQHFNPDRLEALRLAHRLTKDQFAKRGGITRQILHVWLTKKSQPKVSSLERVAIAFGLPSSYFFADVDYQNGDRAQVLAPSPAN